jgi:programmed cell death 6-interacting protein
LAYSCAKLFEESHHICVDENTDFDKDDMAYCFAKAELNRARAQYYKGNDDAANAKYGDQITRYEVALRICKEALASKQAKYMSNHHINDLKSMESLIMASLPKLKKDNELICKLFFLYLDMEATPVEGDLSVIQTARLVKEVAFPSLTSLLESYGPPLFDKLVPFSIREASEEYGRLKEKRSKELVDLIRDSIGLGEAALKALSLPSTLEAFEAPLGLPKSILVKSEQVKKDGGAASIQESLLTLEALASKDIEILSRARKMISDEEKEDDEMRKRFSDNWKRMPSSKLNQNLKNAITNFQEKILAASGTDDALRSKINDSLHIIESLCSSKEELEQSVPSSSANSTIGSKDPTIKLLRQLLDQLKAVHNSLKEIEEEIKTFCSNDSKGKQALM